MNDAQADNGNFHQFMQKLISLWRLFWRWWGSDEGRYTTGFIYLLIAVFLSFTAGFRLQASRANTLESVVIANQVKVLDNQRCFTALLLSAVEPTKYNAAPNCDEALARLNSAQ